MYADIPLWLSLVFMLGGLAVLAWSSGVFIDGASALARLLGISPFIVGMVVIGFGTSAPELCVSALSGATGHAELSLGNAYGSCSFNIAMILGVSVMIFPLVVKPAVTFVAGSLLPLLCLLSMWILRDAECTRTEAFILLGIFAVLLPAYCWFDQRTKPQAHLEAEPAPPTGGKPRALASALAKIAVGLGLLVGSSYLLVWGAVDFAKLLGVSDLVIGLTIVAAGTSLPELASAVASARRGEHEFVLGNIIGSNFFNTLAVVGVATAISPLKAGADGSPALSPWVLTRDLPVATALSFSIMLFGINWRHPKWPGVFCRREAVVWLVAYVGYTLLMIWQEAR